MWYDYSYRNRWDTTNIYVSAFHSESERWTSGLRKICARCSISLPASGRIQQQDYNVTIGTRRSLTQVGSWMLWMVHASGVPQVELCPDEHTHTQTQPVQMRRRESERERSPGFSIFPLFAFCFIVFGRHAYFPMSHFSTEVCFSTGAHCKHIMWYCG